MSYCIELGQTAFTAESPLAIARVGAKYIAATKMRSGALKINDRGISNDGIVIYGIFAASNIHTEFADLESMVGEQVTVNGMTDSNLNGYYRLGSYSCRRGRGEQNQYNYQIHLEKV